MMRPLAKVCEVLGIAFVIGGLFGLAMRPGNVALDVGLIATGFLLYIAYVRLGLAKKRIDERDSTEQNAGTGGPAG